MARISGKDGFFKTSFTAGTPAEVLGITQWTLNVTADTPDSTGMDGDGWRDSVDGLKGWTVSASGHFDSTETQLVGTPPELFAGQVLSWVGITDAGYGFTWSGTVVVSASNIEVSMEGTVDFTIEATGKGELTPPSAEITTTTTTAAPAE